MTHPNEIRTKQLDRQARVEALDGRWHAAEGFALLAASERARAAGNDHLADVKRRAADEALERARAAGLAIGTDEVDDDELGELCEEEQDLLDSIRTAGRGLVIYPSTLEDAEALEARGLIELEAPPDCSHGLALAIPC